MLVRHVLEVSLWAACATALSAPPSSTRLSGISSRSAAFHDGRTRTGASLAASSPRCRRSHSGPSRSTRLFAEAAALSTTDVREGQPNRGALMASPIGIGSCAPQEILTNDELAEFIETSDEWIAQRTGISQRRIMAPDGNLKSLAAEAARRALENAGVDAAQVGLVVVATSSPDDLFGDAPSVAAAVGASRAVAFDMTAACSGFLFATVTASQFLNSGAHDYAVVVGADALSRWVDWDDRNTAILFGDGAGAVVLKRTASLADSGVLGFEMRSNGADANYLQLAYCGSDRPLNTKSGHAVTRGAYAPITMNGKEVYKFATREVPTVLEAAIANAGLQVDQVDWLLLHQANIRIMETVAKRLKIPEAKILTNLAEHGNTSAGSIPLALDAAVRAGKVKPGDVIACAGFGAGLSWGAAILKWGDAE